MNIKTFLVAGTVSLSAFSLGGCGGPGGPNHQSVGAVSGAVIGGLAGSAFGRGDGRIAATIAGAAIGGLVGGAIGAELDAQERQLANEAQYEAFSSGRPRRWRGDREVYGEVIPGPTYRSPEGFCREYTHTIYIGGRPQEGYGTACRQPDGSWQIVS